MFKQSSFVLATAALLSSGVAGAQSARDYISIVGSSTVYPFATVVVERFGRNTDYPTPTIESTGSGGGLKLFCAGVGVNHPDITNSSRRIKQSEIDDCNSNGVTDIVEIKVGYDGLSMANAQEGADFELTKEEVFLALAKDVPNPDGDGLVPNPYKMWSQINPELPEIKIEVLGPPPTSGTRDAFVELVMEEGCEGFESVHALEGDAKKSACSAMREDGYFIEAGENDNLIVQKLDANPSAVGIFGFSFLDRNMDKLKGIPINGVEPTFDNILSGDYRVSRPLYMYVKKAHVGVIPGIEEYVAEFTSPQAWGPDGYLVDYGLIPMPDDEREQFAEAARNLSTLPAQLAQN